MDQPTYIEYATVEQLVAELKSRINLKFILLHSDRGANYTLDCSNSLNPLDCLAILNGYAGFCISVIQDKHVS